MKRPHILGISAVVLSATALVAWADDPNTNPGSNLDGGLIPCLACVVTGQLDREKTIEDVGCRGANGDDAPRRLYQGRCVRYQCLIGYYYSFDGWYATSTCTADVLDDPDTCPNGTCLPLPFITKASAASSCSTSHLPSSGSMTQAYASQLVKQALSSHAQK